MPLNFLRSVAGICCLAMFLTVAGVEAGFRGVEWGASRAEVRASENYPIHHDRETEIAYWNFKFAGVDAGLIYTFEDDALVQAHYLSRHRTSDPYEDFADYQAFRGHLDKHFGAHRLEEWIWADGAEHGEDEQTVEALASGAAELAAYWDLEGVTLELRIVGGDGQIESLDATFTPN